MSLQKTEAIVLKSQRQGETSKILTLYTRKFGKVKVIAKGARSSKSRFGGSLDTLNYISIVFYEKETRDLQFLSQADIIESFSGVRQKIDKISLAMAACELVDKLEIGVSPGPRLFQLLLEVLRGIANARERPVNCFRAFQVRIFEVSGIKPNLTTCMNCMQHTTGEVIFDVNQGGFVCENCMESKTPGVVLTEEAIYALRVFQKSATSELHGLLTSAAAQNQVDDLLSSYLTYHIDGLRELKALKFFKNL